MNCGDYKQQDVCKLCVRNCWMAGRKREREVTYILPSKLTSSRNLSHLHPKYLTFNR